MFRVWILYINIADFSVCLYLSGFERIIHSEPGGYAGIICE